MTTVTSPKARPTGRLTQKIMLGALMTTGAVLGLAPALLGKPGGLEATVTSSVAFLFALVGSVILLRQGWHRDGWRFVAIGIFLVVALSADHILDAESWTAKWVTGWAFPGFFAAFAQLNLTFPTGFLPTGKGWRAAGRRLGRILPLLVVLLAVTKDFYGPNPGSNPYGILPGEVYLVAFVAIVLSLVASAVSVVVRFRLASGIERLQLKWATAAITLSVTAVSLTFIGFFGLPLVGLPQPPEEGLWLPAAFTFATVPTAFALAVLRYRLYEIDRIVSRTVTYALVVAVVAAVYAIPVLLLPPLLGESNDLVIAGSTLAAAAVFDPARRRIQTLVDRRFDRAKYDAEREVDRFSDHLTDGVALTSVLDELEGVLQRTLAPAAAGVWVREPPVESDVE